jgi:hypothetical protein
MMPHGLHPSNLHNRVRLIIPLQRIIRKLPNNRIPLIQTQIRLHIPQIKSTLWPIRPLPKRLDPSHHPIIVVDPHLVDRLPTRIALQLIQRQDLQPAVRGGEHRVGEVPRVRHVVHSEVEPNDQVFLEEALPVEEGIKVNGQVVNVLTVVRVRGAGFGVLALCDHEVVLGPVGGVARLELFCTVRWIVPSEGRMR